MDKLIELIEHIEQLCRDYDYMDINFESDWNFYIDITRYI